VLVACTPPALHHSADLIAPLVRHCPCSLGILVDCRGDLHESQLFEIGADGEARLASDHETPVAPRSHSGAEEDLEAGARLEAGEFLGGGVRYRGSGSINAATASDSSAPSEPESANTSHTAAPSMQPGEMKKREKAQRKEQRAEEKRLRKEAKVEAKREAKAKAKRKGSLQADRKFARRCSSFSFA
jgi:hypothetical protein